MREAPSLIHPVGGAALPYWRLSGFYFFYFALLGTWLPFWPLYLQDLGYGAQAIGALAAVMQGTKIVAPSVWSHLADKPGARLRIIRVGAFAALLVFSAIFLRSGFVWLTVIVAGYSFFWNAVLAQFEVVTLGHLRERPQRYSLVRAWGSAGFIAAVAGFGWLFDRVAIAILPIILWSLLAGIWIATLSVGAAPAPAPAAAAARGPLRDIVRQPVVIAFFAICFLLQAAHGPYYTFFSVYLEQHGYSRADTGLLWALGVVAELALFLVMHRVLVRIGARLLLLTCLALTALRWWLIGFFVDHFALLLFAQCLHAASFAGCHAVAIECVRRLFAGGHEGQGMALYSGVCFGGGAAFGAVGSGLLWDAGPGLTFAAAALLSALAWLIAWIWLRLPAPDKSGAAIC